MTARESWRSALLRPQSLAIIGASDDPAKAAGRPLAYLRRAAWGGRVYPVNPRRDRVQGEQGWKSVASLPEAPDHALILTATDQVLAAVRDCADAGVKVASVLATGFAEVGPAGLALQEEILAIARAAGMRLLGPSSLGYADPRNGLFLSANAAFSEPALKTGRVFAASHSGSLIGALATRGAAKGVGFAGLISVGVEADLTLGEICLAALDDPGVDAFLLFLETLKNAEALARFALAAAERGKPVIAYKLGRSAQAAEMAQSHTGAMAGEDAVAEAFFDAYGIARVRTLDGLLEAPLLARSVGFRRATGDRPAVGVVTATGGGAAMVVDQLGVLGVRVAPPSAETWSRLAAAGVQAEHGRVVDLTMAGTKYETMKATLDVMKTAPEFDLVVIVAGSSARSQPVAITQPIIDSVSPDATPLAAFLSPEAGEALVRLGGAGVAAFRTPESCADAIAAWFGRKPPRAGKKAGADSASTGSALMTEAEAYGRLKAAGVASAPHVLLRAGESPPPDVRYPVAVKIVSSDIPHKSDIGGVVLGVSGPDELPAAIQAVLANTRAARPDLKLERVLVQSMVRGLGEVLIGFRRDADVGPVVMLAPGGVLAELGGYRSVRLAPVDEDEAREMVDEIPLLAALKGYRGLKRGDVKALCSAISRLSSLAVDEAVLEAEINPVIVLPEGEGILAVDALIRLRGAGQR